MTENTKPWWYRFLSPSTKRKMDEADALVERNGKGIVHCGLVYRKGSWSIVGPNVKMKGLRVVEVPTRLYDQYQMSRRAFEAIQTELQDLPYIHASNPRPKRRRPTKEEIASRDTDGIAES